MTAGQEAARRHIEEAREFEREMGGTVSDVKTYFFGLSNSELDKLFTSYGRRYDAKAESYARETFAKWKSGSTKMSGLVAKRLFSLLPPRMPLATKLELAGNVWRHFGTRSTHCFTIGPNADAKAVMAKVYEKLDSAFSDYNIPDNVKARFDWLSGGDVHAKEQLLNYFRQMDRKLATDSLDSQLPVLQKQMRDHASITGSVFTKIDVHNHSVEIWIDPKLDAQFQEGQPDRKPASTGGSGMMWFVIAIAVVFVLILLSRRH